MLILDGGGIGTGVSEVIRLLNEEDIGIKIKHLIKQENRNILKEKFLDLFYYTSDFWEKNKSYIDEKLLSENISENEIHCLTDYSERYTVLNNYLNLIDNNNFNVVDNFSKFYNPHENSVFEGSQALLLDYKYGFRPNTTYLDTSNKYALELLKDVNSEITKIGVIKVYGSRHGMGVFPTEDKNLNEIIIDPNQKATYWNGSNRVGWFDALLIRYSQTISQVDEFYLSSLDKLSTLNKIKICDSYKYYGDITDEFKDIFEYVVKDDGVYVLNIKKNHDNITSYLYKCQPIYFEIDGWEVNIDDIKDRDDLPIKALKYLNLIEELTGVKITVISKGPTRKDKVKVR